MRNEKEHKEDATNGAKHEQSFRIKFRLNHFLVAAGAIRIEMHYNIRKFVSYQILLIIGGTSCAFRMYFKLRPAGSLLMAYVHLYILYVGRQSKLIISNTFG